jgi:hypothetical protein
MGTLPYVSSPGNIEKALNGIKIAAIPANGVTQDFVKTMLKITGGSGDQMTSFLKKIGFANPDGSPTETYTSFRNPSSSGQAIAKALRHGYSGLFRRNEYAYELEDKALQGLVIEETGQAKDSSSVKLICACFRNLNKHASFAPASIANSPAIEIAARSNDDAPSQQRDPGQSMKTFGLSLGYTININLPATSDQAVFNAIFKSIRQNLLSEDDA